MSVTEYDTAEFFKNKHQNTPLISVKDSIVFINNRQGSKTIEFISVQQALQNPLKTVAIFNLESPGFPYKKT